MNFMNSDMEDAYIIRGGVPLTGHVKLSGAKNVALKVIISALLFDGEVIFSNIPRINDVFELLNLIKVLGGRAQFLDGNTVVVDGRSINTNTVDLLHASRTRVSFMLFAPLLYKFGECYVPNPGGCRIGARPIDRIVQGLIKLGIDINYDSTTGFYNGKMNKKPSGYYKFPKSSHTGTELLILMAIFGAGQTVIDNAAREPEIDELIKFLNESGADIKREGIKIIVSPVGKLIQKKPFTIISDRNEAVTYATLALTTKGEVTISGIDYPAIETFVKKLQSGGGGFKKIGDKSFKFFFKDTLTASHIETAPYPGFMTDWQPNWAVLMTQAKGESTIYERVFENRFSYVEELRRVGAVIDFIKMPQRNLKNYFFFNFDPSKIYNQAIRIKGPQTLHGGVLDVSDLRAGATLVIAALTASGESVVNGRSILERGYEDLVEKIKSLGGDIEKI